MDGLTYVTEFLFALANLAAFFVSLETKFAVHSADVITAFCVF